MHELPVALSSHSILLFLLFLFQLILTRCSLRMRSVPREITMSSELAMLNQRILLVVDGRARGHGVDHGRMLQRLYSPAATSRHAWRACSSWPPSAARSCSRPRGAAGRRGPCLSQVGILHGRWQVITNAAEARCGVCYPLSLALEQPWADGECCEENETFQGWERSGEVAISPPTTSFLPESPTLSIPCRKIGPDIL